MADPRPVTEQIDRLFLELSQFTSATTKKELALEEELKLLRKKVADLDETIAPAVHFAPRFGVMHFACGISAMDRLEREATDAARVTCSGCMRALAKDAALGESVREAFRNFAVTPPVLDAASAFINTIATCVRKESP